MSAKTKNIIIQSIAYVLFLGLILYIVIVQYIQKLEIPKLQKIALPSLIAVLVLFLVFYKKIKEKIARKLSAIETAKELGNAGTTNSVTVCILESLGVVVPVALLAAIFLVGGSYLKEIGKILVECLLIYLLPFAGNIWCKCNIKAEMIEKKTQADEKLAEKIASKMQYK